MDQREILLQNLERAQSRKLNQEAFADEFLVSLLSGTVLCLDLFKRDLLGHHFPDGR